MRSALLLTLPALVAPVLAATPKPIAAPKPASLIDVRVDQRIELMSIVCRLAGYKEYNRGNIEDYNAAVDTYFGPFKSHAAVQIAKEMRHSVYMGAIPNLAARVSDARTFKPSFDLFAPDAGLYDCWKPEFTQKFLDALASFAKDTKAETFFTSQAPLFQRLIQDCRKDLIGKLDQTWFAKRFTVGPQDTFMVCISLLNGDNNYGVQVSNAQKGQDVWAVLGSNTAAKGAFHSDWDGYFPTLIHEFLHSFANPWVDRHMQKLRAFGDALNAPVIDKMKRIGYGEGFTALYESMVRAFTICYFREVGDAKTAKREENGHENLGFYWVKPLADLLGEYTSNRNRYKDLEAFTPRLVEAFKLWAAKAPEMAAASQKDVEERKRARAEQKKVEAQAKAQKLIDVRVDQRFELLCIVCRLAGFGEYRTGQFEDYVVAVDTHFAPFQFHSAVKLLQQQRKNGVAYDAIPNLAVRVKDAKGFEPILPLSDPATGLDTRWNIEAAPAFLKAMADFARDTKAEAFFTAQAPTYAKLVDACQKGLVNHLDLEWYGRTFGNTQIANTFTLGLEPLLSAGNYGASLPNAKGGEDIYAFIKTNPAKSGDWPVFDRTRLPTLVHECLHSYTNPWVERHLKELQAHGDALNAPVVDIMRKQAYGTGTTALIESMVRAFTIRYFIDHGDLEAARAEEKEHAESGFYWVKPLSDLLGEYTRHRDQYKDLEAFTPRLVEAFKTWAPKAKEMAAASQTKIQKEAEAEKATKSQAKVGTSK